MLCRLYIWNCLRYCLRSLTQEPVVLAKCITALQTSTPWREPLSSRTGGRVEDCQDCTEAGGWLDREWHLTFQDMKSVAGTNWACTSWKWLVEGLGFLFANWRCKPVSESPEKNSAGHGKMPWRFLLQSHGRSAINLCLVTKGCTCTSSITGAKTKRIHPQLHGLLFLKERIATKEENSASMEIIRENGGCGAGDAEKECTCRKDWLREVKLHA